MTDPPREDELVWVARKISGRECVYGLGAFLIILLIAFSGNAGRFFGW